MSDPRKPVARAQPRTGRIASRAAARLLRPAARYIFDSLSTTNEYPHMTVGLGTYGQPAVIAFKGEKTPISIGAYCSISEGVELMPGGNHPLEWVSTYPFRHVGSVVPPHDGHPVSKGPIRIGNDVWIARGARILSGVTVGNGAVIGAYSVVSHDVAPYAVVAGVPARQMRLRFSEAQVARLEAIAWWDWRPEEISAAVSLLNGGDVDDFIRAYDVADSI